MLFLLYSLGKCIAKIICITNYECVIRVCVGITCSAVAQCCGGYVFVYENYAVTRISGQRMPISCNVVCRITCDAFRNGFAGNAGLGGMLNACGRRCVIAHQRAAKAALTIFTCRLFRNPGSGTTTPRRFLLWP